MLLVLNENSLNQRWEKGLERRPWFASPVLHEVLQGIVNRQDGINAELLHLSLQGAYGPILRPLLSRIESRGRADEQLIELKIPTRVHLGKPTFEIHPAKDRGQLLNDPRFFPPDATPDPVREFVEGHLSDVTGVLSVADSASPLPYARRPHDGVCCAFGGWPESEGRWISRIGDEGQLPIPMPEEQVQEVRKSAVPHDSVALLTNGLPQARRAIPQVPQAGLLQKVIQEVQVCSIVYTWGQNGSDIRRELKATLILM